MAEEISRERILTELAELAFCRSNDAVRLVFIAEEGTPDEVFNHPKNPRCRDFLSKVLY